MEVYIMKSCPFGGFKSSTLPVELFCVHSPYFLIKKILQSEKLFREPLLNQGFTKST
jgi:hypothetical protein